MRRPVVADEKGKGAKVFRTTKPYRFLPIVGKARAEQARTYTIYSFSRVIY
jgi:hypothetical protein